MVKSNPSEPNERERAIRQERSYSHGLICLTLHVPGAARVFWLFGGKMDIRTLDDDL